MTRSTPPPQATLTQDELKTRVGQAALQYVVPGEIVGVGTGSTVNKFIDALASMKDQIKGAVSSSVASTERLLALGIPVLDANAVDKLSVYIDGADEIDGHGNMVKGGGAALTREKIVAALAAQFVCIADESKLVQTLGQFPLPVEVIPMATRRVIAQFAAKGGAARVRLKDGVPLVTAGPQRGCENPDFFLNRKRSARCRLGWLKTGCPLGSRGLPLVRVVALSLDRFFLRPSGRPRPAFAPQPRGWVPRS